MTPEYIENSKSETLGGFTRADLSKVRDAANAFLVAYIWRQGDGELNHRAVLASLRNLRREINLFVHAAGLAEGER
ncbi:hypothetical protein [Syntrophotalea carbinolica]|uniref:hypothetical protein n=1 Tax=Syntrophotalea carbinolica TaxID=19 RepID=UPI00030A10A8|nr:hypothetical protein [Syntrophotalea carbinolica]